MNLIPERNTLITIFALTLLQFDNIQAFTIGNTKWVSEWLGKIYWILTKCSINLRAPRNHPANIRDAIASMQSISWVQPVSWMPSSPETPKDNVKTSLSLSDQLAAYTGTQKPTEELAEFHSCLNAVAKYGIKANAAAIFCLAEKRLNGRMIQDSSDEDEIPEQKPKVLKNTRPPSTKSSYKSFGKYLSHKIYTFYTGTLTKVRALVKYVFPNHKK